MAYYNRPGGNKNKKKKVPSIENKKQANTITVLNWIFSVFCFTAVIAYGFSLSSVLFLLIGVLSLPIGPIKGLWTAALGKLPKSINKWFKPAILTIVFFVGVMFVPDSGTVPTEDVVAESITPQESVIESCTEEGTTEEALSEERSSLIADTEQETPETLTESPSTAAMQEESLAGTESVSDIIKQVIPNLDTVVFDVSAIPAYGNSPYVAVNNNQPYFNDSDLVTTSFEKYSELDSLGRCGVTYACVGKDIMPTEERNKIGMVKPSGWQTEKYNGLIDGNYLYNRCHLIGYQLTGENANTKNLITGTRYMNVEGMLPFENMVADYVKETNNHVMYRVTPIFEGSNLLASGVLMEAKSVEDNGAGIEYCVYCYNVQPGIAIDYATGDSELSGENVVSKAEESTTVAAVNNTSNATETSTPAAVQNTSEANGIYVGEYIVNTKNGKIHINGECSATDPSHDKRITVPQGFSTYEEAEAYSAQIEPSLEKRKCGNCW